MNGTVAELYGARDKNDIRMRVASAHCPFLNRTCLKTRKSRPNITIGTCSVDIGGHGPIIICPFRFLERQQVFTDALHLLTLHEPGNELHIVPEIQIPGGNVDYFLVSARDRKPMDFVGIEVQSLDTTGTVWPARQRFLQQHSIPARIVARDADKVFGINWKMNAKTILVQLHHKAQTFEHLSKHLVLVVRDVLLDYMQREFTFDQFRPAVLGDPIHIHAYALGKKRGTRSLTITLQRKKNTDVGGVAKALGLRADPKVALESLTKNIAAKLSDATLWQVAPRL